LSLLQFGLVMKNLLLPTFFAACVCLSAAGSAQDSNWPQWRGPQGDGTTTASGVVTEFAANKNVKWRIDLPEAGNSTPIVWGDRVFVTQPLSDSKQRALMCLDRETGGELWVRGVEYTTTETTHNTNPYCSASPVTDGERVIAWFGSAGLVCWDFAGTELWRRDLGQQEHMWGYGSSPIMHDGLCILNFGPGNRETLIAVDVATGETRWEVNSIDDAAERELSGPENDGNANDFKSDEARNSRLRGSWNTPLIIDVDGRSELIAVLPRRVTAFDPATGKELWTCGGGAPLAYASPMESDGVIVALGGYGGATLAVKAGGSGNVTDSRRIWHHPKGDGWLGTGVADDGAVYVCNMNGVLSCTDVQSGEELWKARVDGGGTWSSITQTADGLMFLLTKSGSITVFRPSRESFQAVSVNQLQEKSNASVVIAGSDIFVRTDVALWAFGQPKKRAE